MSIVKFLLLSVDRSSGVSMNIVSPPKINVRSNRVGLSIEATFSTLNRFATLFSIVRTIKSIRFFTRRIVTLIEVVAMPMNSVVD